MAKSALQQDEEHLDKIHELYMSKGYEVCPTCGMNLQISETSKESKN